MRGLTKKERRALELEIKKTEFDKDKLRVIVREKQHDSFYTVAFTIMDDVRSQILFVPFKSEPDIKRIVEQLGNIAPVVTEAM